MVDQKQLEIPDYLKEMVHQVEETKGLISAGGSIPRISLKGRVFRYMVDGEEIKKVSDKIHVIVLGVQPEQGMAKTYYKDGYQPGSNDPPDCSSQDGVVPDTWISTPVSPRCATCPMNAWGSATSQMTGKKTKACKDSKRLMVVDPKELVDGTIYVLNVTVASLKALSSYGKFLVSQNVPMAAVLTTVHMVDSDFPQIEFEAAGILKAEKGKKAIERASKKEWNEFNFEREQIEAPEGGKQPALPAPASAPTPAAEKSKPVPDKEPEAEVVDEGGDDVDKLLNEW